MKTQYRFWVLISILLLAGCSKDDNELVDDDDNNELVEDDDNELDDDNEDDDDDDNEDEDEDEDDDDNDDEDEDDDDEDDEDEDNDNDDNEDDDNDDDEDDEDEDEDEDEDDEDDEDDKLVEVDSVQYKITFNINWNKTDFPTDYPSNAHFSQLVGWSHKPTSTFMKVGTLASEGIKNMAETGSVSPLDSEIDDMISNQEGHKRYNGTGLGKGVGKIELTVEVDINNSSISLVSMIAPSPDWYIGVINLNLHDGQKFVSNTTVFGEVYDAGTDSGVTFASSNNISDPQQPIQIITESPLGDGTSVDKKFCTIEIEKI